MFSLLADVLLDQLMTESNFSLRDVSFFLTMLWQEIERVFESHANSFVGAAF